MGMTNARWRWVAAAGLVVVAAGSPASADDVVVTNAAVPVVPAAGPTPLQRLVFGDDDNDHVPVFGPYEAGTQIAVTGFTAANTASGGGNPGPRTIALTALPVSPQRVGGPKCDTSSPFIELLTFVVVPKADTVHISYSQPLLAPPGPSEEPWCLGVYMLGGNAFVTVVGYVKPATP